MSKEIRKLIDHVNNLRDNLVESIKPKTSYKNEINKLLESRGFVIKDIYDVENVTGLIGAIKLNSVVPNVLYEAVDFELANPGGVIIFSTDLNATLGNAETLTDKIKYFFDSKWKTFLNRFNVDDRLKKILLNKHQLKGYTVGKNFRGLYTAKNGMQFNEKSFTIDLAGIDSDMLKMIASEICREFKQEVVMVRDFNEGGTKVYFVNDTEYVKP
jgi:hypothetical protein